MCRRVHSGCYPRYRLRYRALPDVDEVARCEIIGLDLETKAIKYAMTKMDDAEFPKYVIADARHLPFKSARFNLIICMMGTFSHVPREDQQSTLDQVFDALSPGGHVAISTWDMDCSHLSYLSIYNERQKDLISSKLSQHRKNA